MRQAARGTRAAVAAGSDYATDSGMRMYYKGGNAVDAGVAAMFAAAVTEFSHFGLGGEAPILIRTKDGKVHAIAGVGTMPKLATADFFRNRPLQTGRDCKSEPEKGGLKGMVPVAGLMPALVPGMVEAGLVALREYGTKSFTEVIEPAIELADGSAIDEMRAGTIDRSRAVLRAVADFEGALHAERPGAAAGRDFPPARSGAHAARHGRGGEEGAGRGRQPRGRHRRGARLLLSRRNRAARSTRSARQNDGLLRYEDMAAFRLQPEEPVSTTFHGYAVYKPGFWSQGPAMIEALNILSGYRSRGHEVQFGRVHPYAGGSAEAGLRGSRHLLRRSQVHQDSRWRRCSR